MKARGVKWNTVLVKRSRLVHQALGYIAFFSSTFVLSTGILKFLRKYRDNEKRENIAYLAGTIVIMLGIYISLEINFRVQKF